MFFIYEVRSTGRGVKKMKNKIEGKLVTFL